VDGYAVDDDPSAVDVDLLHRWLSEDAYWWSGGLRREVLETALGNSITLTCTSDDRMVAFARLVTDRATFAYLCDVYVDPAHRGRGLGTLLARTAVEHPAVQTCRRVLLATADAHGVYERAGFAALENPSVWMAITRPEAAG
jgi:predicted GNAT family acetyltransferase